MSDYKLFLGDCLQSMKGMDEKSVNCCVTSPPYFGLRDYGVDGQMGLEATPQEFVAALVTVMREVKRVLRDDGTLWLNLGDSYCSTAPGTKNAPQSKGSNVNPEQWANARPKTPPGLKPKDLIGIPWRVAFALQADGWYLRQDIIWQKPNPMPESVTDRCTKSHEYVFLLSKSPRYYFDHVAIKEPVTASTVARLSQNIEAQRGSDRVPGKTNGPMKAVGGSRAKRNNFRRDNSKREQAIPGQAVGTHRPGREDSSYDLQTRNRRSVWTIATRPFKGAHFATFPPALIEPCIMAGCPVGGVVLDPFGGSGTTAGVAMAHGRNAVLCEINPEYADMMPARIESVIAGYEKSRKAQHANDNEGDDGEKQLDMGDVWEAKQ